MDIEETIKECEICLKQIKQHEPDPFYVNYFFERYVNLRDKAINGIFEEANRDFGLFLTVKITEKSFEEKAKSKDDKDAIIFSKWFQEKYIQEHGSQYPNFIDEISNFKNKFKKMPDLKIMIRARERYRDDISCEIKIQLKQEKLRSKAELDIEIKRQAPMFLEVVNHKRKERNEPKVEGNQIVASTFMDIGNHKDVEIVYAAEIYIPLIIRLVEESRKKIQELTK